MFKDQIFAKGLMQAPEELEIDVLLYAAQNIEQVESSDLESYFSWLPFAGLLLLVRDLLKGYRLRILPEIKI